MTPEQAEIVAKLKEIEEQTSRLLGDALVAQGSDLVRTRIVHIQNLAKYLRSTIATDLTLVKKRPGGDT